ncbi:hypothetical protein Prum_020040 [Phytohabitans rumicis]|uniref:Intradiol ring-cleavage dioxygenases domain-containing protein n=2 Tax=Phytohabitans rumicis TaxID=1076125 RepID=A0A6V8KTB5_9ACTN|nr:hypothetical protein Prum_020040 [Phytohabitans rumicis]
MGVRIVVAMLGVLVAVGCDGDPEPAATPSATPVGCARPAPGTAEPASALVPGPTNGLARSTAGGDALLIEAVILDAGCRPAGGADLRIWHTDARGLYGPADSERCCYYEGTVRTDHNGRFRLSTIRPAQYPEPNAPPAHIHLEIRHPSASLTTQIVFGIADPPATVAPTGQLLPVPLRRDGTGWRGDAVFVLGFP